MTNLCRSIALIVLAVGAAAGRARGADGPLLVAVEVAPGVDVAPGDVRQAVARELGIRVVGSREPAATTATDVLLVGLDASELRMSLRAGASPAVSRTIATPPDRASRLRSISWLAGNLGRDQVGPIVAAPETQAPAPDARPATQPPPFPATAEPPASAGPEAVVTAGSARDGRAPTDAAWTIAVGGGPTVQSYFWGADWPAFTWGATMYHVDVQHHVTSSSLLLGVTLEGGPSRAVPHYVGAAAFIGSGWHGRRFLLEGTVGFGLEAVGSPVARTTVSNNNSGTGTTSDTRIAFEPVPAFYARTQATGGVRLSRAFDLVAQVAVHLSSTGQLGDYLSSTAGLRLRLP